MEPHVGSCGHALCISCTKSLKPVRRSPESPNNAIYSCPFCRNETLFPPCFQWAQSLEQSFPVQWNMAKLTHLTIDQKIEKLVQMIKKQFDPVVMSEFGLDLSEKFALISFLISNAYFKDDFKKHFGDEKKKLELQKRLSVDGWGIILGTGPFYYFLSATCTKKSLSIHYGKHFAIFLPKL